MDKDYKIQNYLDVSPKNWLCQYGNIINMIKMSLELKSISKSIKY